MSEREGRESCSSTTSAARRQRWSSTRAALRETGSRIHETPVTGRVIGRLGDGVRPVRLVPGLAAGWLETPASTVV